MALAGGEGHVSQDKWKELKMIRSYDTLLDAYKAVISHRGDLFWITLGTAFSSILAAIAIMSTSNFETASSFDQIQRSSTASLAGGAIFLLLIIAISPRLAFTSDSQVRSFLNAIVVSALLLAGKWFLNRVYANDDQYLVQNYSFATLALTCCVVPFVEEVFFRGLAWNTLKKRKFNEKSVLIATSFLYVVGHLPSDAATILQFVFMGTFLGLTRLYSGSIWIGFITHGLMNLIVIFSL